MNIRKMLKSDIPKAEYICLATADAKLKCDEEQKQTTLLLYSKYYTRAALDSCFVLTDENDCAVGYILCAPSYKKYKKEFCKNELKELAKINPRAFFNGISCVLGNMPYAKDYPAHMHIDILPEFQAKGYGGILLTSLCEYLKSNGITGLMLIVDSKNFNAVKFYKKHGFKEIKALAGGIIMGVKL
ncbi:MAG: GNAT family N-acetyltransferase [Eubacterium sp.]|nr:GNAT family N-acetyltransferase [Eubacterium sp.]MDE6767395.1 GNAT family N-acetyltransferase [Eubacterium sp.]